MISEEIEIINKKGLHARAAASVVSVANRFDSECILQYDQKVANAKSIMSLLILAAKKGERISVTCKGSDELNAFNAIKELIENKFNEED